MAETQPHVVILGGGFAGLYAAKTLAKAPVKITLVDRSNHHLFQPLLYQVATAGLSAVDIARPIRLILKKQRNVTVLMAEAERIDPQARRVSLGKAGELSYDRLIVATGATHSYFGNEAWEAHAPGLKTLEDALDIRRRVLLAYERAETEPDPQRRQAYLTFVVIGAGPTGAELAGALSEIAHHTLVSDFRRFDSKQARVLLLEGMDRVLPPYPPELSAKAQRQLEKLNIEVRTGARVTGIDSGGVWVGEERIEARTVIWAAGVAASPLGASLGAPLDRAGRVKVEKDLSLAGHPECQVVGDLTSFEQDGAKVPGVAPAAVQQGEHAARNILRALEGKPSREFRYRDKGSMATLGRKAAVAELGKIHLSGLPAWLAWLMVHIFFLIGFRNRFVVLFEWAWAYLTYQRSARLILHDSPREPPGGPGS
ncbi:MAG: NAD(P)/FAD-dependent oxidoreductase [Deltaproteobacteria bacterium]|nr:NAD(P)/FAD-dependent oxidoreductase [Deltaproteobacteria bacterium]